MEPGWLVMAVTKQNHTNYMYKMTLSLDRDNRSNCL